MTKQSLVEVLAPDRTKSELERMFDDYLACMRVAVADRWKTEGGLHVDLQRRGSDVSLLLVSLRFQSCNSFSVEKRLRLPTLLRKLSNAWAAQLFIKIGRLNTQKRGQLFAQLSAQVVHPLFTTWTPLETLGK